MVNLYHDTMPKSPDAITWPNPPVSLRELAGDDPDGFLDMLIEGGYLACGEPDEVTEQIAAYQTVGCDQLVFGIPNALYHEEVLEMIELFGQKVIPEFDKDPIHSTTRYREGAVSKYPEFGHPVPDVNVSVLPRAARTPGTDY